jgi:hypothetical protein
MMITSSTSISGNQVDLGNVTGATAAKVHRPAPLRTVALAVQNLDQTHRLLLHLDDETIHQGPEVAPEDHARNGDQQPKARVVEGHRNAVRQLHRVAAARRLRPENLDHADDGTEQAHQGADRGNGAQRRQIASEAVNFSLSHHVRHDQTTSARLVLSMRNTCFG